MKRLVNLCGVDMLLFTVVYAESEIKRDAVATKESELVVLLEYVEL